MVKTIFILAAVTLFILLLSPAYARDFAVVNLTTVLINASGGANTVAIATGAFTNVSIGTDVPAAKLHVRGDVLIDNKTAVASTTWTSIGGPAQGGPAVLAVYNGSLYSDNNQGDVYRYDGGTSWTNVTGANGPGAPGTGGARGLTVYNGQLYAGDHNGKAWRYDGGTSWTDVSVTGGPSGFINSMAVYNGQLYAAGNDIFRYNGTGTTAWTDVTVSPGTLSSILALTVYNGQLYAGDNSGGDVYRYDGVTTWTDVVGTPTNLGAIRTMTVYNGQLYAGVQNGDIFRYDGGTVWTNISGSTPDVFVETMTVYNGQLYAGDNSGNDIFRYDGGTVWTDVDSTGLAAEFLAVYNGSLYAVAGSVYKYTANPVQSYALKFKSGEGNEIASLWFQGNMSSGQGIEGQQQHGQFIFSHGIQTQTGAYDIAEEFPTWDYSIEAGDIVVASTTYQNTIEKSSSPYQNNMLGIVPTKPGLLLTSNEQSDNKLVSLAGRVAVKVSTENGAIAIGDFITSSSTPGVGMKATKAGRIVGMALEPYDGHSVGRIKVFMDTSWYDPSTFGEKLVASNLEITSDGGTADTLAAKESSWTARLASTVNKILERLGFG